MDIKPNKGLYDQLKKVKREDYEAKPFSMEILKEFVNKLKTEPQPKQSYYMPGYLLKEYGNGEHKDLEDDRVYIVTY